MNKTEMDTLRDALRADEAFRHEFLSAPSHEAAAELAGRRGWSLTPDDIRTLRDDSCLTNELSDSELEKISGGVGGMRHEIAKNMIGNLGP